MNKKGAVLSLMLAGAMSFGVLASAGCTKRSNEHIHTYRYESDGAIGHHRVTDCTSHEPIDEGIKMQHDGDICSLCGYNKNGTVVTPVDPDDPDTPVVLNEDTAISLTVGDSQTLSAAAGAQWTSSDAAVASVSGGVVKALSAGVTKVRATSGNSVITCTVIVLSPLGGSSQTVTKDPFSFSKTVNIGSVSTSPTTPEVSDPNAAEFKVDFSDGAVTQNVAKGGTVVEPLVENDGNYLTGWRAAGASSDYDFSTPVTSNLSLTAQWAALPSGVSMLEGHYESIAVEFGGKAANSTVSYKLHGGSDSWHAIDAELIRDVSGSVRADILGLKAGVYDVKVNDKEITGGVHVAKYDRSGYAHFNYTQGVGAYNDDGTLKNNALVIYVTDENKDTVMEAVCAANNDVKMFQIPGSDWGNKNAKGIGWWLNNNQYTSSNAGSKKNKVPSNTYDETNGGKLGFKSVSRPIVIRFIGTVTTPEGCTAYNDTKEGGGVGDNGHMARLKNLKNVTLEGVGDDAEIRGWGFHFVAGTDAKDGEGKSFEVRNLTFNEYPEDAIGMEGQATSTKITAPVERCWIHNNTFLPGRCDSPAESDKKEGDGSCDFKRGYYFTCSYNYFEYCHKTNLIGSSDSSLQYNMTYHHNIWYQCGSRIPLTRQANVHFYNNYVFGDPAEKNTPYEHIAKPSLSYVHSLRASCYLFSENNYYEGSKAILRGASEGGDGKFYGNTYYACSDQKVSVTEVATREQSVSSKSKDPTTGISYENFDTNPEVFYYDKTNKKTKVEILDDSVGARIRTVLYSGAQGHSGVTSKLLQMNTSNPVTSPSVTKLIKGKGQVVTFSVAANTAVTIDAGGVDPQIIRNDGKVVRAPFSGEITVVLDAGVYMVCSGIKDKEITINSLSVQEDSEAAKTARIEAAKKAIGAIPDTITRSSASIIVQAEQKYATLISAAEKEAVGAELTERLKKARAAYDEVMVAYAIARIDYIGTVTPQSGKDITLAGDAYKAVSAASQSKVTNYNKLTEAQTAFAQFEVQNVQSEISRLPATTTFPLIIDSKPAIELALGLFNDAFDLYGELDEEDKLNVTVTGVSSAIETLTAALKPFDVKEMIAALDETAANYISQAGLLKKAYEALTAEQKAMLTEAEKAIYDKAVTAYTTFASQAVTVTFLDGKPSNAIIKSTGAKQSAKKTKLIVKAYSETEELATGLKFESSTTLEMTLTTKMTVSFYLLDSNAANTMAVNGQAVELKQVDGDNVATITLEAGTYKITRAKSENSLYYMTLVPAA